MIHPLMPATAADVPELAALVNSAYRGPESEKGWTTEAHLLGGQRTDADALREMLAAADAVFLLARTEDGTLAGSVYLHKQTDALYLGMLSVAPTLQAHGLGKHLLRAAEDYARRQDCFRLRITVISVRTELLAWYERHGYQRTGATEPFPTGPRFGLPRQPLELVVLEKPLD
ncbi:GNAT family N-acetyltransferase [Hymenobacter fastidiosus]|uniref:GNAT family N-acetyltransferase n=1 Tax=Hymenobacter fastidiosus TaxID=486264 RepID=A0ABP7SDV8_9BACT